MRPLTSDINSKDVNTNTKANDGIECPEEDDANIISYPTSNGQRTFANFSRTHRFWLNPTARTTKTLRYFSPKELFSPTLMKEL